MESEFKQETHTGSLKKLTYEKLKPNTSHTNKEEDIK